MMLILSFDINAADSNEQASLGVNQDLSDVSIKYISVSSLSVNFSEKLFNSNFL